MINNHCHSHSRPFVSLIIPCRNEERHIKRCLESLIFQDYNHDKYDIIVADGSSTDNSVGAVRELMKNNKISLLNNEAKVASAGLNMGIRYSNAEIIIILGAHSLVSRDFISQNVKLLNSTGADCVGGKIETTGEGYLTKTISLAMSCYFGVGNAKFRCGGKEGYADTVAFGAYRRKVFDRIGLFDETLLKGQDAEFNYRLRHFGGKIFFNPSIKTVYYNRRHLAGLWIRYFRCGYWKIEIAKRYPKCMQYRQFVPSLFILGVLGTGVLLSLGIKFPLVLLAGVYGCLSLGFAIRLALYNGLRYFPLLPLVFLIMHTAYGLGFLLGLGRLLLKGYHGR